MIIWCGRQEQVTPAVSFRYVGQGLCKRVVKGEQSLQWTEAINSVTLYDVVCPSCRRGSKAGAGSNWMGGSIECGDAGGIKRSKREAFFIYCLGAWLLAYATGSMDGSANDHERSISDRLITVGDTFKILQSKMSRMRGSDLCVGQHFSIGACV